MEGEKYTEREAHNLHEQSLLGHVARFHAVDIGPGNPFRNHISGSMSQLLYQSQIPSRHLIWHVK